MNTFANGILSHNFEWRSSFYDSIDVCWLNNNDSDNNDKYLAVVTIFQYVIHLYVVIKMMIRIALPLAYHLQIHSFECLLEDKQKHNQMYNKLYQNL